MNGEPAKRMQNCLDILGIDLTVCWCPRPNKLVHGEIKRSVLLIYDEDEQDAWETFMHEVFEFRFQRVVKPYHLLLNALIETMEKIVYHEKEGFVELIPKIIKSINEAK